MFQQSRKKKLYNGDIVLFKHMLHNNGNKIIEIHVACNGCFTKLRLKYDLCDSRLFFKLTFK